MQVVSVAHLTSIQLLAVSTTEDTIFEELVPSVLGVRGVVRDYTGNKKEDEGIFDSFIFKKKIFFSVLRIEARVFTLSYVPSHLFVCLFIYLYFETGSH